MTSSDTHDRRHTPRAGRMTALALSSALLGLLGTAAAHADTTAQTAAAGSTVPSSVPDSSVPDSSVPVAPVGEDPAPAAPLVAPAVAPASFTLPLFGVSLTVDITTGPGGALSSVTLNPADNAFTAIEARPNKVAFVNEDGSAKVVVKSKHGGQRVEVRAGSLADIVGPGGWTGEVFPGALGSVAFDIVDEGGSPNIIVGAVSGPNAEIGEVKTSSDDDGDDERVAKVAIRFSQDGQSRVLTIKAEVETDSDDDEGHAKVRISLSKIKTSFTEVNAVGPHRWDGTLCTGDPASILFTVAADGTLTIDQVTPAPERQKMEGKGAEVRFGEGERVRIRVRTADGSVSVKIDEKIRCSDSPEPSLNVPFGADDDEHDDDEGDDGDHNRGDRDGSGRDRDRQGRDGGDDDGDNPTDSTTPSVSAPSDTIAEGSESDD